MFETSEALARDIQLSMHPWLSNLEPHAHLLGPGANPALKDGLEKTARVMLANLLVSYVTLGHIPRFCAWANIEEWAVAKASKLSLMAGVSLTHHMPRLQLHGIGTIAEEIIAPLVFANAAGHVNVTSNVDPRPTQRRQARTSISPYVQNVMRNVQRSEPDDFALNQEQRALLDIISPQTNTLATRRAAMAEQLVESIRQDKEAETKAKEQKEAVESTGFGRLLDLD